MEGGPQVPVSELHVCALINEEAHDLRVAVLHSHHQRRTSEAVNAVDVATAQVAQHGLDALQVAVGSWEWGRKACVRTAFLDFNATVTTVALCEFY